MGASSSSSYADEPQLQPYSQSAEVTVSNDGDPNKERTVDDVIEELGFGTFQIWMLILAGMTAASDGVESVLPVYIQSCLVEYWSLSAFQETTITAASYVGQIVGYTFSGPIADTYGRRTALMIGWSLIVLFGILTALSPDYATFVFFRTVVGMGTGMMQTVMYDLVAEFFPTKYRSYIVGTGILGNLSVIYVNGAAWIFLPMYGDVDGWRFVAGCVVVPIIIVIPFAYFCLPESPRWLAATRQFDESAKELIGMMRINHPDRVIPDGSIRIKYDTTLENEMIGFMEFDKLFANRKYAKITLTMLSLWVFMYYSFNTIGFVLIDGKYSTGECEFNYEALTIIFILSMPASFLIFFMVDLIGRRMTLIYSAVSFAISALVYGALENADNSVGSYVAVLVAINCSQACYCATWLITSEVFPTDIRGTGHSSCAVFGRFGAIFAVAVYDNYSTNHVLGGSCLLAAAAVVMGLIASTLPETRDKRLENTLYEEDLGRLPLIDKSVVDVDLRYNETATTGMKNQ